MITITATEFRNNLSYYVELSKTEDILVTKNNKIVTVLTNEDKHRLTLIASSRGFMGKVPAGAFVYTDIKSIFNEKKNKKR